MAFVYAAPCMLTPDHSILVDSAPTTGRVAPGRFTPSVRSLVVVGASVPWSSSYSRLALLGAVYKEEPLTTPLFSRSSVMLAYVGIDVSKSDWAICAIDQDASVLGRNKLPNSARGEKKVVRWILGFEVAIVVVEATGGYERRLVEALTSAGIPVAVVNPYRVRLLAKALGILAKNDPIDAFVIARFAQVANPPARCPVSEAHKQLAELVARAEALRTQIHAESNRLEHASKAVAASVTRVCGYLKKELARVEKLIDQAVKADAELTRKTAALESIKGIGRQTAVGLLAQLPELGTVGRKQIAALCGLAPYTRESGKWKGKRFVSGGRKKARRLLYMPALTAARHHPRLAEIYQSLIDREKPPKVAITAIMRRLIIMANAMVRDVEKQHGAA